MEKYSLILKNDTKDGPSAIGFENVEGPRVPFKGETITSENLSGYIVNYANEERNLGYIRNFHNSEFIVDSVTHAPENNKGKLEAKMLVEATKIAKKK